MKKSWIVDTIIGLFITLLVVGLAYWKTPFTESLENKLYDLRLKYSPKAAVSDQIILVAIDEQSIASVGRWPWPRSYVAQMIDAIAAGEPKVIGVNILYVEPDQNQGLTAVRQLKETYVTTLMENQPLIEKALKTKDKKKQTANEMLLQPFTDFIELLSQSEVELDNDAKLAQTLTETPNLVLPIFFSVDKPLAEEPDDSKESLKNYQIVQAEEDPQVKSDSVFTGYTPLLPLPEFSQNVAGMGHSNIFPDLDGSVRRDALFVSYKGQYFPSLSLEMSRVAMGLKLADVKIKLGQELVLGPNRIPLDRDNRLLINYSGPWNTIKMVSAVDILAEKVPAEAFKGKIVLIGTMATGIGTLFVVPVEATYPANGILVNVIQNIMGQNYISRPIWAPKMELAVLGIIGLLVIALLPHLKAKWGALVTVLVLAAIIGPGIYLFTVKRMWIKIFYSVSLMGLAYVVVTVRRFFFTERRKELVEAESIETNKMLGLSFQGQGMLDMAFEKFRKCPVDNAMKELLYNLALDFERKRQFGKAVAIYEHISKVDAGYKDIKDRQKNAKTASEGGIVTGLGGPSKKEGTIVMEGASVKPTLGRYEIEKELGRGAMGIVYLGKDPKINRQVAIKTVKFDDDVDEATAKEIKARFFREAESAGTLNHPNIIRIYDAGEDNEISYIAMELLDGEDLKKYGEKANLLPVNQVLEYVALVADGLDYAHANGVVHRDIKPANIMRLKDGTLRITDFGIARITASSKTQTGTVMGTPSYMSPEQVAGKKVDGRADLFSLGVMLYEMLTGEKPFEGDSLATLLFRISGEQHPDPTLKANDRVTRGMKMIIDKALMKTPEQRYQRGRDFAGDLREIIKNANAIPSIAGADAPAPTAPATPSASYSETLPLTAATTPVPPPPASKPAPSSTDTVRMPPAPKEPESPDSTLKIK
ncbi:MAG TPA: serine/threonine-protein kinase [Elusimicrobiota bacterium]|nr:serine/threonine-protein kinase [Elusimicrobiota bacterium]